MVIIFATVIMCFTACDKSDITEPNDKNEQVEGDANKNEGDDDKTGNENGGTPSEGEGEGESEKVKSMTITLEKVTATKAYFRASTKNTAPDIEIGIYYSTSAGEHIYDCDRVWEYDLENGECELVIKDLDAKSTYYYRPYLFINGSRELGDELSFITADYSISVNADVYGTDVTFTGYADIGDYGGILYSTESQLSVDDCIEKITPLYYEYSRTLKGLSENTTYYYRTYYRSYERYDYVYGAVKSFTTGIDKYAAANKDLPHTSAIDLSSSGTANCYIVSKAGLYKIKAVKGNDGNQILENASSATILWETFGTNIIPKKLDLIKEVCYKDGYLIFKTADTYREGNAVIAVKNAEGNILWSWHIWMTDQPQEQIYPNNAGTMMDRNLGAISTTPNNVGAFGLLYQWGRKDPFLGSSHVNDEIEAESTITWPSNVSDGGKMKFDYTIAHPTTFIISNYAPYPEMRWTETDESKSITDPCPVGWRVPENNVWEKAGFTNIDSHSQEYGWSFSISSPSTTWFPFSGYRYGQGFDRVGSGGTCWSCSESNRTPSCFCYYRYGNYNCFFGDNTIVPGRSVRCIKE